MTARGPVFLAIAALALGYGLGRAPGFFGAGEAVPSAPSVSQPPVAPAVAGHRGSPTRAQPHRPSAAQSSRLTAPAQSPSVAPEPAADAPPIDPGEFLEPDEGGASALAAEQEPIDIGPQLDADEPLDWELHEAPSEPVEIGSFLDAGGTAEP